MYKWIAILKDGTQLDESRGYGLQEEERKKCKWFSWENSDNKHRVSVNLENGSFEINGQVLHAGLGDVANLSNRPNENYRLIYAKRHFVTGGDYPFQDAIGVYLVGWQINDETGKNIKRILYVYPDGQVIFGGED